ncbi:hypothetical protein G3580_01165 [Nitrogeniibacter mangrovi]|uniref:PilZ domain-containing protein n=1 Tax=Nitrogeniibacter mangrovi TaxID=2016596 RepID=A0A6C1AYE4_9RHOO|nr:hypothetical protein [Nitrogeniibacter mangrovi]QID16357.1 hypothetical protein G3580_01165 [Nitrogeniibacter mangrovi]
MNYYDPNVALDLIRQINPVSVSESHQTLARIVTEMHDKPPAADRHFEVLEAARTSIAFVQEALARRYADHPLPPESEEETTLRRVVKLWRDLANSYALIAQRDAAQQSLGAQRATLMQRRLHYAGLTLLEYFRAHRAVPAGLWLDFHAGYSVAEQQGVARTRVADPLNEVWKAQSSVEAYVAVLLVDLANPFGRSQREFDWVCRWAQRFAPYCALHLPQDGEKPGTYALDLSRDHGLRPLATLQASPHLRRFDGTRLAGQIQAVLTQFKQGVTPSSLGLGDDCTTESGGRLLLSLYRPWGLASAGRRYTRRSSHGRLELCADWESIGFFVLGKPFESPRQSIFNPVQTDIAMLTFGARADEVPQEEDMKRIAIERGYIPQMWDIVDQSVGGFRLQCQPRGQRLEHHQLVGIRPPDGEHYLLAHISWLMYRPDGIMELGVHTLPGLPEGVAVRLVGLHSNTRDPFKLGFLLPAVPALKAAPSLIVPGGWYQAQRIVELKVGDKVMQARLTKLATRGSNFDRVEFTTIGPA